MTGIIIVACGLAICALAAAMIIYFRRLRRAKQRIAIGTVQQCTVPLPSTFTHSASQELHWLHIGRGGWRQALHFAQHWKRSSCCLQKP